MSDLSKLKDEDVVVIVKTKNQEEYSEIIRRYEKRLMRYAKYLLKDEDKAADVVQEAFIKAFVNINSFNTKKKFSSWIYRIVHNEAINVIKKYKKEVPIFDDIEFESEEDIEDDFSKKETVKMVKECLSDMPILYKEPLTLFSLEDKSYSEISDILRIPVSTVGTRIKRAKLLMKKICLKNQKK